MTNPIEARIMDLMRKKFEEQQHKSYKPAPYKPPTPKKIVVPPPKGKAIIIPPPTPQNRQGVLVPPEGKATILFDGGRVIKVDYDKPQETEGDPGIADSIADAVDDLAEHAGARAVYYREQSTFLVGLAVVSSLFVVYWLYNRFV